MPATMGAGAESDLDLVVELASTTVGWSQRVDVQIEIDPSLQRTVTDTYRLEGRYLRDDGGTAPSPAYVPILFESEIDIETFAVDVLSTRGSRRRDPVPMHAIHAVMARNVTWTSEKRDLLRRCLIVPLEADEMSDDYPLIRVRKSSASVFEERNLTDTPRVLSALSPVGHQQIRVSPASDSNLVTISAAPGIQLIAGVVDVAEIWRRSEAVLEADAVSRLGVAAATRERTVLEGRRSVMGDMKRVAQDIADLMDRVVQWLDRQAVDPLGWSSVAVEDYRGHAVRLSLADLDIAASRQQMEAVAAELGELVEALKAAKLPAAVDFPSSTTKLELLPGVSRLDVAFTSDGEGRGSGKPWSLGTAWALVSIAVVCLGVLAAAWSAESISEWLDTKADAVVALLAIAPVLVLTQVERADAASSPAALYARRVFLWALLTPLVFPLMAAFIVIQQEPQSSWLKGLLLAGSILAGIAAITRTVLFKPGILRWLAVAGYTARQ